MAMSTTPSGHNQRPATTTTGEVINYTHDLLRITMRAVKDAAGGVWFVAADVCAALGIRNPRQAVNQAGLVAEEFSIFKIGNSRGRPSLMVSESGLYALVMNSRKAEAQQFRQWITGTVIPSLSTRGGYLIGEERLGVADREAFHADARQRLDALVRRVDDHTWHHAFKHDRAGRQARAIAHCAAQEGIPLHIARQAYAGDRVGAEGALIAARQTPGKTL